MSVKSKKTVEPSGIEVNKEANPERAAFLGRTHTVSILTVTLEIFSPRQNAADFGIATNMQQLGIRLTEALKSEAISLVKSANDAALQYEEFTPGLAISRAVHHVAQKDLPERDYNIYLGMVTDPTQGNLAN